MSATNRARAKVYRRAALVELVETVVILREMMRQSGSANAHYKTVSVRRPTIPYSRAGCLRGLHESPTNLPSITSGLRRVRDRNERRKPGCHRPQCDRSIRGQNGR